MTPEEWGRLKPVFEECVDLDPGRRRSYLDAHCHDPAIRREVESLLESHEQAGEFIERPVLEDAAAGRRLGAWETNGKIGEGGIGCVYRARRCDVPFEQVAALKLLKLGVDSEEVSRHFLAERRILASLNHPHIARLIDGGITADGRPYFVMEFVEGVAINIFVERRGPTPRQICAIMRQVCDAVDYAHRRLVVHRDLKPSNVLVTEAGEVKLLDFGIAKILSEDEARTETGIRLLTPDYASPEQIRGEPVTTASDVYSLGVMLYRLLSGKSPYRASGSGLAVAVALEREAPVKPSATAGSVALKQELAGDLDTIVMKALEPDPARRYASAAELAGDLLRYESGYPILARPQTLRYRARKLVARNRVAAAVTAVAILAIVGGAVTTLREAQVARAERLRAEKRYNDVRHLANALLFDVHDAIADLPGATKARALVVARATEYLDRVSSDAPGDWRVRLEVANAYIRLGDVQGDRSSSNLGDHDAAQRDYRRAATLLEPLAARGGAPQIERVLATAYTKLGGLENARRALAIREVLARASPGNAAARNDLARSYFYMGMALTDQKDYRQALTWFERDRDAMRALLASRPDDANFLQQYAQALKHQGAVLVMLQRAPEALASYQEALASEERWAARQPESRDAQMAISFSEADIGLVLNQQKGYAEAIRHYRRAIDIREKLRARDPHDDRARWSVWSAYRRVGFVYLDAGDPRRGVAWYLKSEEAARPAGPLDRADALRLADWIDSCADLARSYRLLGRPQESLLWEGRALDAYRQLERRNQTTPYLRSLVERLRQQPAPAR